MALTTTAFDWVCTLVRKESAIVLEKGKEYLVESRLVSLARAAGASDVDAYVTDLARHRQREPLRQVVEALTTNETSWFRDAEPFVVLRQQLLPTLAAARAGGRVRVWCAACSTGQEPYSVAMTALEVPALAATGVDVLATDLSEQVLERARRAEYSQLEVNRGLPATSLVTHFERVGVAWRPRPTVTRQVTFRQLNLLQPYVGLGRFDREVLRKVRQVLAPDGYLVLGAAEMTMGISEDWTRLPGTRSAIYQPR